MLGKVKWFSGEGLRVYRAGGREDVSSTTLPSNKKDSRHFAEGEEVEFEIVEGSRGPQAANVTKI